MAQRNAQVVVTPEDVRQIDRSDGVYRVACGAGFDAGAVRALERPGDRLAPDLTHAAAERIAAALSAVASQIMARKRNNEGRDNST